MTNWTILSLIFGITAIVFFILKFKKLKTPEIHHFRAFEIWIAGLLALIAGFVGQILGMRNMFDAIEESGTITPEVVSNAFLKTLASNLGIGLLIFVISIILWTIVYRKSKALL